MVVVGSAAFEIGSLVVPIGMLFGNDDKVCAFVAFISNQITEMQFYGVNTGLKDLVDQEILEPHLLFD